MKFELFKNIFKGSTQSKNQQSLLDQAQSIISNSFRKSQIVNTNQFDDYLKNIPQNYKRSKAKSTSNKSASIKPQLLKRCYENVDKKYFNTEFTISEDFFTRNRKTSQNMQMKIHQDLDQVQICLFNQISSRFDEILSVFRTIESLQCLVEDNQQKLKTIRQKNLKRSKQVVQKQRKIKSIIQRKKRLEKVLAKANVLKKYQQFSKKHEEDSQITDQSAYYLKLQQIKNQVPLFIELSASKNVNERIQQFQGALKKSFSDSINDALFKYITEIMPYQKSFWSHMAHKIDIFDDEIRDPDSTVILDQSVLIQEQQTVVIKLSPQKQQLIINNLKRGWLDSDYTIGALKARIDKYLKDFHAKFLGDFRNYCNQMCQRFNKPIDNPSLSNLVNMMTISFCAKVCQYFNDAHKNFVERLFSLTSKCISFILSESQQNGQTIQQKEKMSNILEGLTNTQAFALKIVSDKICQLFEIKAIFQTTDLVDFKNLISTIENEQFFINKKIKPLVNYRCPDESFLQQKLQTCSSRLNLQVYAKHKKNKLQSYVNKMHKYVLQSELKQNLQCQIWNPVDIPTFYYDSIHYLISGQSLNLRSNLQLIIGNRFSKHNVSQSMNGSMMFDTSILMDNMLGASNVGMDHSKSIIGNFRIIRNQIIIEGKTYKVTQTVLLIIEILEDYLNLVQSYPFLKQEIAKKIAQLLRYYNSTSCQLIVHAAAVLLTKFKQKNKNIAAKHLALSSLCLQFLLYLISCVRKRADVSNCQNLVNDINNHVDEILKKLNTILYTSVNNCLAKVNLQNSPSKGTQMIVIQTKKLHDILIDYYQKPDLRRVFTMEVVKLYVNRAGELKIINRLQAQALKDDITFYFNELKWLQDLIDDFSKMRIEAEDVVRKAFESL